MASLIAPSLERALRALRFDYTDALLLGLWNGAPPPRILDACRKLRDRGLVRYLAVSTHNRPLIASLAADPQFDIRGRFLSLRADPARGEYLHDRTVQCPAIQPSARRAKPRPHGDR